MKDGFYWGQPDWLWGLVVLLPLGLFLLNRLASRRTAIQELGLTKRVSSLRSICLFLSVGFLLTALAQPRLGYDEVTLERKGRDIVVVLDASRSMWANDIAPNRMERARRELLDLIPLLEGERLGLVFFAGGAFPRMPLSRDYKVFEKVLRDIDPSVLRNQGSDIGSAVHRPLPG